MKDHALSMRYVKALFEIASQKEAEVDLESALLNFLKEINGNRKLFLFFQNPILSIEEKKSMLSNLLEEVGSPARELSFHFLTLLIRKTRFGLLESILESYHELMNKSRHFEEIIITTARPIKPELRSSLEKVLQNKIGEKIISEAKVDSELLGGIHIQIRNRLFDGSLRTKLDDLRKQMVGS